MRTTTYIAVIWGVMLAWMGAGLGTMARADSPLASFALLNEPGGDTSVQCSASGPCTMHISMTNHGDVGGTQGFVRVTYGDRDAVDYAIPANTTVQLSLIGGSSSGLDDTIKVSGDGAGGSVLIGQVSALIHSVGGVFCCTSPTCPAPF
jgi:hypothetical protein